MILACRYARQRGIPYFGICLGMQICVIEYARTLPGFEDAHSREFAPESGSCVIDLMEDQAAVTKKGGTMRLGAWPCRILPGTALERAYQKEEVLERHRHRYEFSNVFRARLEEAGLRVCGTSPDGSLVEAVEIPGSPFHLGVQFHPEFKSRPDRAHPLFREFVRQALRQEEPG